ncbi:MAG: hypothetical protein IJP03_02820 [Christensenellaceae bacterium]|nr:hypothetical protein [Christensenellaceae bacterium]
MKRMFKKLGALLFTGLLLAALLLPTTALAASASASASPSSAEVGDSVTVKVTFKGENIAGVTASFSFDSSILQYVSGSGTSNGKIVLYASEEGKSALSTSIKFKALKAGSATVSVSVSEMLDFEENSLGKPKASAKVTVTGGAAATPTPKPTPKPTATPKPTPKPTATAKPTATPGPTATAKPTLSPRPTASPAATATPAPSPTATPAPEDQPITVTVDGKQMILQKELPKDSAFDGFTAGTATYEEHTVAALKKGALTLCYLTTADGTDGGFYLLAEDGSLQPYESLKVSGRYILLPAPDTLTLPVGYLPAQVTLGDHTVEGWQKEGGGDFYLVYAMDERGNLGLYVFDAHEGTLQRLLADLTAAAPAPPATSSAPAPQLIPEVGSTGTGDALGDIMGDSTLRAVFLGLAAACGVLLIAVIALAIKTRRKVSGPAAMPTGDAEPGEPLSPPEQDASPKDEE